MIKVTFKEPQDMMLWPEIKIFEFHENTYGFSIFNNTSIIESIIPYTPTEDIWLDRSFILSKLNNNIQSIEHVKPTDL